MEKSFVVRQYELFFYAALETQWVIGLGTVKQVRESYYRLEIVKQEFDRALLQWRSVRDWIYGNLWEAADGWELYVLENWVQKEIALVQFQFRIFLREHQEQAFPAETTQRKFNRYEEMLYQYYRFGALPYELLSSAAD